MQRDHEPLLDHKDPLIASRSARRPEYLTPRRLMAAVRRVIVSLPAAPTITNQPATLDPRSRPFPPLPARFLIAIADATTSRSGIVLHRSRQRRFDDAHGIIPSPHGSLSLGSSSSPRLRRRIACTETRRVGDGEMRSRQN